MGGKAKARKLRKTRVYESPAPTAMPAPVTFTLDGFTYTCRELGALELSEMARMHGLPADDPRSVAFMAETFEALLGTQMYREFRMRCGQFQTPPEMFVTIIQGVFEDFSDRPTGPQSAYSDGLRNTDTRSTDDSSSQAMSLLQNQIGRAHV